jgi:hypothetical protein
VGEHPAISWVITLQMLVTAEDSEIWFMKNFELAKPSPVLFFPTLLIRHTAKCLEITELVKKRKSDVNWNTFKEVISSL